MEYNPISSTVDFYEGFENPCCDVDNLGADKALRSPIVRKATEVPIAATGQTNKKEKNVVRTKGG